MPTTKVLHISDVHLDLSYKVGTDVDCGMPMCCMNFTEMANDTSKGAGYWGEYYCDTPVWTFENMLSQIKEQYSDVCNLETECASNIVCFLFEKQEFKYQIFLK